MRLSQPTWNPDEHSLEENLRWALLRAMEWLTWPNFISQPIVPILLYFYPWPWVIGSVVLISFAWRMVVAPVVVSPTLANARCMVRQVAVGGFTNHGVPDLAEGRLSDSGPRPGH
jgi:hypothetical protein